MSKGRYLPLMCLALLINLAPALISPQMQILPNPTTEIADEGQCTMKDVESANNEQLGIILKNVRDREFFRWFKVDLEVPCNFWKEEEVRTYLKGGHLTLTCPPRVTPCANSDPVRSVLPFCFRPPFFLGVCMFWW